MKIDHLVVNVDRSVHEDQAFIKEVKILKIHHQNLYAFAGFLTC